MRKNQRRKASGKAAPDTSGRANRKAIYTNLEIDPLLLKGKFSHLRGFFVRGAPCVLSENLCTTLGYAKGTQGIFESVVWDPNEGEVPDINSLPRGVLTTVMQPKFILVRVKGKLIPIGTCNAAIETRRNEKIRVTNFRKHPVDLLFAVTYHKVQGVTLDKLILSINKHPNYLLRLALSSLYVGISRVKKLDNIRVLPYSDEDVDYLVSLQFDDLLKAWIQNYTNHGRWKHDGFKKFEQNMIEKTVLDLGLVDDLALLTIQECKGYLSKLDIIATGTKVNDLHSALRESYSKGRDLLNAGNGMLLIRQRKSLFMKLRKLGDYRKLTLSRLRCYAKRLGICHCVKMQKNSIISALNKFETTHCAGMFASNNTQAAAVRPVSQPVNTRALSRKGRKRTIANVYDDIHRQRVQKIKYKGLVNPKNTCFFNTVMQCLLHCPLARQTIESVPERVLSIAMREIRILFKRMTADDDAATSLLPSECFHAVMDTRQCRSVQMYINKRQEDVTEFFLKLLEHFEDHLFPIAEVFNLPYIFNDINTTSTLFCHQCSYSSIKKEYLSLLTLPLPLYHHAEPITIYSLMDSYFGVENLGEHPCSQCRFVGGTERKLNIINAPQLLVMHLGRFTNQFEKIENFVKFTTELRTVHITDGNGQQTRYRLTGIIEHKGASIGGGHYVAFFSIKGKWFEANDSHIRELSWETVRAVQAYVLFYEHI